VSTPARCGINGPMTLVRAIARPLLASAFISSGVGALRDPKPNMVLAERLAPVLGERVPYLPKDPVVFARLIGAKQVAAGALLATGRMPRLAAFTLAAWLVPRTLTTNRFWADDDPEEKARHRQRLLSDLALVGGLLLAAVDTEGKPGLAWRAQHAGRQTRRAARRAKRETKLAAKALTAEAKAKLPD
jgi:putative oxidoreductase